MVTQSSHVEAVGAEHVASVVEIIVVQIITKVSKPRRADMARATYSLRKIPRPGSDSEKSDGFILLFSAILG